MKKITLLIVASFIVFTAISQNTIELTFTAVDSATHIQLDSIKVMNRTHGGDTVLYWPDTVLVLDYQVGLFKTKNEDENLRVFQNYPNPVKDRTNITIYIPEKDKVSFQVTDILGQIVINTDMVLDRGFHSFQFTPGSGEMFFFTANWKGSRSNIKVFTLGNISRSKSLLQYSGIIDKEPQFEKSTTSQSFPFTIGDVLQYICYENNLQSNMFATPESNELYTFQFATNIPCLDMPTITYEGQVYNTIQICNQCWLKENLNVGLIIDSLSNMEDNGIIEKYCYKNEPDSCIKYGGLYQWNEMMQYTTQQGSRGICPAGWHVPTDREWKILEGVVDSQFGINDSEWDKGGSRGFDVGIKLKSTIEWDFSGSGIDAVGFTVLPAGLRQTDGHFYGLGQCSYIWSSTDYAINSAWYRLFESDSDRTRRGPFYYVFGFSVRCIKD